MEEKLKDPKNGISGYTELLSCFEKEFSKQAKCISL